MPDSHVRTVIAHDDPLARRLIKQALQAGTVVIAEATNGREAVDLVRKLGASSREEAATAVRRLRGDAPR